MEDRLDNNHFYNTIWKYKICQTSLSFGEGWGEAKNGLFYISKWYKMSLELWDEFWNDSEVLLKDIRGREIAKQLTRSVGSISANIADGYGRGFGKEYPQFLRISRASARESKGWYVKSKFLLPKTDIETRTQKLDSIIAMITKAIQTLEGRGRGSKGEGR